VVKPGILHQIKAYRTYVFRTIEIKFFVENQLLADDTKHLPTMIAQSTIPVRACLENALNEAREQKEFSHMMVNLYFTQAMLNLIRHDKGIQYETSGIESLHDIKVNHSKCIVTSRRFIDENITHNIETSDLCRICSVSESKLYADFKHFLGTSPNQYIIAQKIKKAKDLMLCSDMNVTQIAESLGFSSLHYFSRFFKKREGIAPIDYIHSINDDIRIDINEKGFGVDGSMAKKALETVDNLKEPPSVFEGGCEEQEDK
jgi:AraC-like DNA-binding protein